MHTRVVACADLVPERAQAAAGKYDVPRGCTVEVLLRDPEVEIVVNLTIPRAHAEVIARALEAGKHVYSEKPLAIRRVDGADVLAAAAAAGASAGRRTPFSAAASRPAAS